MLVLLSGMVPPESLVLLYLLVEEALWVLGQKESVSHMHQPWQ
jgi:hypothetical protein